MAEYLVAQGADPDDVRAETASTSTRENLLLSREVQREAGREGVSLAPHPRGMLASAGFGGWLFLRTLSMRIALLATIAVATNAGTEVLAASQVAFTLFSTLAFALDALAIAAQRMRRFVERPGREWALVEHNRLNLLRTAVGADRVVTPIDRDINNKFLLVRID